MRKYIAVVVILVVVVVSGGLLAQSSQRVADFQTRVTTLERQRADLERQRADLQERLRPYEAKEHAIVRINKELVVGASSIESLSFSPSIIPGTISGSWRSSGHGWGGADDTINGMRLTDAKDSVIYSAERGSSGNFVVKVSAPGTYTFYIDNRGLFRTTPRRVFLDAEFRPD